MHKLLLCVINSEIAILKLQLHLPGDNELTDFCKGFHNKHIVTRSGNNPDQGCKGVILGQLTPYMCVKGVAVNGLIWVVTC